MTHETWDLSTEEGRRAARAAGLPVPGDAPQAAKNADGPRKAAGGMEGAPAFVMGCLARGLPFPIAEYQFYPGRKWRFDWAWPDHGLAIEIEGGIWTKGRHTRGKGFLNDIEKYNRAAVGGWRVLRCTPEDVATGVVFAWLEEALRDTR